MYRQNSVGAVAPLPPSGYANKVGPIWYQHVIHPDLPVDPGSKPSDAQLYIQCRRNLLLKYPVWKWLYMWISLKLPCPESDIRGLWWPVAEMLYNYSALLWQKEASDKSDISCKRAKCVCHLHWRQWNIMTSYLTYLLAWWVFMHKIWPGRRAH